MISPTTAKELDLILTRSEAAAGLWADTPAKQRAQTLDAVAGAMDAAADELVAIAGEETHLSEGRLRGELKRTTFQLRFFADNLREGSFLDARIDHSDPDWPMGAPRPDLRRQLEPMGPVLVFAASNFPFAFSVAGGDTASALAAGCSVVLKAHSGHPRLADATGTVVREALATANAPDGLFALIRGTESGRVAVVDQRVKAASFTGSIPAGRALFDLASSRPVPIPFYGELGSVNPVFVTRAMSAEQMDSVIPAFVDSFTLGAGQFCTKPGVLMVPADAGLVDRLASHEMPPASKLLNERIQSGYIEVLDELSANPAIRVLVRGESEDPPAPTILSTDADSLLNDHSLMKECFGPTALIVEYTDESQLLDVARILEGQLTASIFGTPHDDVSELVKELAKKAGRLLWNQWPTGVSVTHAQQHGGPYPAATSPTSTSVGAAALTRFLRPVAYQGFPQYLLPDALQDENPLEVPQRIDGRLTLPKEQD